MKTYQPRGEDGWTRNRIQVGIQCQLAGDAKLQVFYLRQNDTY
jgi:hypothetical protein